MSWLSPSTEIVTGWLSSAYAGHGILGSAIPSTGDNGGSPVLNDTIVPSNEYRWVMESAPSSGTLTPFEDCSFEHSGAVDGIYSFTYRLYENGVSQGTATVTLQVGPSVTTITATTANTIGSSSSHSVASCTIAATTSDAVGSLNSSVGIMCSISATTANAVGVLTSYSTASSQINATTGQVVGSMAPSSGVCATALNAATAQIIGSLGSTGYVSAGLILTPADINAIVAAVLAALNATTIPVDMQKTNGVEIVGDGTSGDKFRSVLYVG